MRSHSGSGWDIFAATLDDSDGSLTWYTFLGGNGDEGYYANCGIDAGGGNIYVTSSGVSRWTEDAVNEYSGGREDAFVAKLDADDGSLMWHTFMGSGDSDYGYDYGEDIAVDGDGNAFITGWSYESWGSDPVRDFGGGVLTRSSPDSIRLAVSHGTHSWAGPTATPATALRSTPPAMCMSPATAGPTGAPRSRTIRVERMCSLRSSTPTAS